MKKAIINALSERDEDADICKKKGEIEQDTDLRDYENIALKRDIEKYFQEEVHPFVPDAWMDRSSDKVGYEINFTQYFWKYKPLRPSDEILHDIKKIEKQIPLLKRHQD